MSERYYFISDVHLGTGSREQDRARESRLLILLTKILDEAKKGEVGALYIVGDLFDSWFEFSSVIPRRHVRSIAALANIAELVSLEYLMGNHDFGHRDFFADELGIPVIRHDIKREHLGKRLYIAHGDGKAAKDTGYLILRRVLRSRFAQAIYRVIHPDLGIPFAEYVSGRSRDHTSARSALREQDGMKQFAERLIATGEYDFVVMGHRHKAEIATFEKGSYVNLGDWIESYTYGVLSDKGFQILEAPKANPNN